MEVAPSTDLKLGMDTVLLTNITKSWVAQDGGSRIVLVP